MSSFSNPKKVMIPCRFSFLHCWEPDSVNGSEPKYSVSAIIPKSDTKTVNAIKAAIEVAKQESLPKWGGKIPPNLKLPLRDGDIDRPEDEAYAGCYFLNANSREKPQVVDKQVQPILDQTEVYSGCYGRITVTFYGYNSNGNRGVAAGLGNIQKLKDGDSLGGRATRALLTLRDLHSPLLLPDAKAQVTYDYEAGRIDTFLISTQHRADVHTVQVKEIVRGIMVQVAEAYGLNTDFRALVNPTGRFVQGGSFADAGVTGRKIIADTYGGMCRHGGGAFSGKDPTKVDRSAAYMARKIARDFVLAGYAKRCEIQLAYAIGMKEPVSVNVNCFGTETVAEKELAQLAQRQYDLTPAGIIKALHLKAVDYNKTAAYGHFGKPQFPWEQ